MSTDLTCTLRVTSHALDITTAFVRSQRFGIGRPIELDVATPRIAALEYALGALAGELVNGLRQFAWRRRVDLEHVEALVTGELEHGLAYLEVVGEDGVPRLAGVSVKVFVTSSDDVAVGRLWTLVLDRLPLLNTFRTAVPIQLELIVTP